MFHLRSEGLEPPTYKFVACCSIQLSYDRIVVTGATTENTGSRFSFLRPRPKSRIRRERDSNPRYDFTSYNGLANRRLQPLGHLSRPGPAPSVRHPRRRCLRPRRPAQPTAVRAAPCAAVLGLRRIAAAFRSPAQRPLRARHSAAQSPDADSRCYLRLHPPSAMRLLRSAWLGNGVEFQYQRIIRKVRFVRVENCPRVCGLKVKGLRILHGMPVRRKFALVV